MITHELYKSNELKTPNLISLKEKLNELEKDESKSIIYNILINLIQSYNNNLFKETIENISKLNQWLHANQCDANFFNSFQLNFLFIELFKNEKFQLFFDNILRPLNILIFLNDYNISEFEEINFFMLIINNVVPKLRNASNGFEFLANILNISHANRSVMINDEIIEYFLQIIPSSNELIRTSIFSFFASALKGEIEDFLQKYIQQIENFFIEVLNYQIENCMPGHLLVCCEILYERIPLELLESIFSVLDFKPLFTEYNSDYEIISLFKLIQFLYSKRLNINIYQYFTQENFGFIFADQNDIDYKQIKTFFKTANCLMNHIQSDENLKTWLINISINIIEQWPFNAKVSAFEFLTTSIQSTPSIIPILLDKNFISLLSQYIECSNLKIKCAIIKSLIYIFHIVSSTHEFEYVYPIYEDEDLISNILNIQDTDSTLLSLQYEFSDLVNWVGKLLLS